MLGIDRRLMVRGTGRWIGVGVASGVGLLALSVALYWQIGKAIDAFIAGRDPLDSMVLVFALLLGGRLLLGWLYRWSQYQASSLTKLTLRDLIYQHALKIGPAVLDKKRTGELVNTAVDGMDWIELFYGVYFVQFIVGMATPLLLCIFIGIVDWVVGLALIVSVPLTPLFLGMMARNFRKTSERYAEVNNQQSARFLDSIQGMATLKMFNLGKRWGREIRDATETQRQETMRLLLVNQIMILFVDFGFALGTIGVLAITSLLRFDAGVLTAGQVVALILCSAEFAKPLTLIGEFFFAGAIGREFAKKIIAFLEQQPPVVDPVATTTPPRLASPQLKLQHVMHRYGENLPLSADDVTLELRPGETVALVGRSGSGKTTIANLVLRTLAPNSGTIMLDALPIEQVPAEWTRAHVALVPQDPYLFHGTIADNLRLAKTDASIAELEAACQAANILTQIHALPAGFDTTVGERGTSLSGGQVQRLAIARALLKDAPIVVLDEPTSQIDLETEGVIHEALDRVMKHKTVLLIAHRLSTVRKADRIVVLDHGRVIESGTHAELIAHGGTYARMVGTTQRAESPDPAVAARTAGAFV